MQGQRSESAYPITFPLFPVGGISHIHMFNNHTNLQKKYKLMKVKDSGEVNKDVPVEMIRSKKR